MFSILKNTNLFVFEYGIRIRVCKITPESELNLIRIKKNSKHTRKMLNFEFANCKTVHNSEFLFCS